MLLDLPSPRAYHYVLSETSNTQLRAALWRLLSYSIHKSSQVGKYLYALSIPFLPQYQGVGRLLAWQWKSSKQFHCPLYTLRPLVHVLQLFLAAIPKCVSGIVARPQTNLIP